jgi:SAM-dependent methyltransferase/uncharacterized protein YbaR (Trm112 family)
MSDEIVLGSSSALRCKKLMKKSVLTQLRCPDCYGAGRIVLDSGEATSDEVITSGILSCEQCSATFPIVDSIPILLPKALQYSSSSEVLRGVHWVSSSAEHVQRFVQSRFENEDLSRPVIESSVSQPRHRLVQQKLNQRDFMDIPWDKPYTRPYQRGRMFEYVGYHALRLATERFNEDLSSQAVLNVGCGHGFEAEYLANSCGARELIGTDISLNSLRAAQRRARLYGYDMELVCADIDNLPFVDNSFALAVCHETVHHLPIPQNAIVEMARVSRSLMVVNEPVENLIRNAFRAVSHIGRQDYETSGNYSYHFLPKDLTALCRYLGFKEVDTFRFFTTCPQEPPKFYSWFENRLLFWCFRKLLQGANAALGARMGIKLSCIAKK